MFSNKNSRDLVRLGGSCTYAPDERSRRTYGKSAYSRIINIPKNGDCRA